VAPIRDDPPERAVDRVAQVGPLLGDPDSPAVSGPHGEGNLEAVVRVTEGHEDDVVVDDRVDLTRSERRQHVAVDVVGAAAEGHRLGAVEGLCQRHVRARLDGGHPSATEVRSRSDRVASAHEHALVEDRIRAGEVDLGGAQGCDALPAQDGVCSPGLDHGQQVGPGDDDPLEGAPQLGGHELGHRRLEALAAPGGPVAQAEERRRVGVDADEPERLGRHSRGCAGHGASSQ
jgi:hypothetical protein